MFHQSISQPHEGDYQYLEKIFGDESDQLSPAVKRIIAQALKKVRENSQKKICPASLQVGLEG